MDYPIIAQTEWEALRDPVFAALNNAGASQNEPIGGLGRYGSMDSFLVDVDTINVEVIAKSNDNFEFHFDTSSIDNLAIISYAVMFITADVITTGPSLGDYYESFDFALRDSGGNLIRMMTSDAPDFGGNVWRVVIPISLINNAGDTDFKFTFESPFGSAPIYPIGMPDPDNDSQYWQGWFNEPQCKLYVLTDLPCTI